MFLAAAVSAQGVSRKKWSVIPRVGVNFSNLGDMSVFHGNASVEERPKTMSDITAGAEFRYFVHPAIEVSVGAFYSRQGCHYKNYHDTYTTDLPNKVHVDGVENSNIHLQYFNIPVMGSLHLSENVALQLGVQCGVFLDGHWVNDYTRMDVIDGISQNVVTNHVDDDLSWMCASTVWSMPIGVEFEYEHVLFSGSYAIPLSGFCKKVPIPGGNPDKMSRGSNRVLTFSVGYRF